MNRGAVEDTKTSTTAESAKWLRRAADQGCLSAMNNLGFLCQYGWGGERNIDEAVKWYRAAAEKGDPKAQANLGLMFQDGFGVEKDCDRV